MMKLFLFLVCVVLFLSNGEAFGVDKAGNSVFKEPSKMCLNRWDFLATIAGGVAIGTVGVPSSAWAKDDSKEGTKKDPAFEACLSTCMYECTKPKGAEQKSRKECLPECKISCAKTKAQLMTGEPKSE